MCRLLQNQQTQPAQPAQPKGKPKCVTCGKFHNGRSYCFYPSGLRVGRFTDNHVGECLHKSPQREQTAHFAPPKINCSHCGKLHKGKPFCLYHICLRVSRFINNSSGECRLKSRQGEQTARIAPPSNNCSYCGKKGHAESVCYKNNPKEKPDVHALSFFSTTGRITGTIALKGVRVRDHSIVEFPLSFVGAHTKWPGEQASNIDVWIEDSDGDAIMCLHDCRGGFCFERLAHSFTGPRWPILISQREEQAIWQTMTAYGTPNNGFGGLMPMDLDENAEVM